MFAKYKEERPSLSEAPIDDETIYLARLQKTLGLQSVEPKLMDTFCGAGGVTLVHETMLGIMPAKKE
jgi:hypothetical protein